MLPPPTTIASSTPSACTPTISSAIAATVLRSMPYEWSPISDSPESFSRTRRKVGAPPAGERSATSSVCTVTRLFCDREALEGDDMRVRRRKRLTDRLCRVVDPGLLGERAARLRCVEALREHALDDLLLRLVGLPLELVGVEVDLLLGLHELRGYVVLRRPLGRGERDVHRKLACELLGAARELHEHADLVRRRMGVGAEDLSAGGLVALRAGHDDVLAEPRGQLDALVLELRDRLRSALFHGLEHLDAERLELVVLGDGLRLAADRDHRPSVALEAVADEALGRRAAGALGGGGHTALTQEGPCGLEVAVRLLQRLLARHHPRAGGVAELLDERCRDRAHVVSPSSTAASVVSIGVASASGAASAGSAREGSGSTATPAGAVGSSCSLCSPGAITSYCGSAAIAAASGLGSAAAAAVAPPLPFSLPT